MKNNNLFLRSDSLGSYETEDFERACKTLEFDKVLSLLSTYAATEGAKQAVLKLRPHVSIERIRKQLSEVSEAKLYTETKGTPSFGGVRDITRSMAMAQKGAMLSMGALLEIAGVLSAVMALDSYLTLADKAPLLDEYHKRLIPNKFLRDKITTAILSEDMMADNASAKLFEIRRSIKTCANKVRDILQKYTSGSDSRYLQESIVTIRNGRYVVPVKSEHRGEVKGLIHDTSASGSTVFIEPMQVVETNNRLRTLEAEEKAEIERILYELTAECDRFSSDILTGYEALTELAVIFAKAEMSHAYRCCEPIMNTDKRVELIEARHPLLDQATAVPISVNLGKRFTTLIITGPNTGGKTVSLKTIGLLSLMAQAGLHIPAADGSTLPVFESIFADIGDEQSIEQSLSTFSAHMVGIVEILRSFTPHSLILFDELGAGTDPIEGAALAQSILERVTSCACLCAATTHYAELKSYALDTPGVSNASCEFDVETLRPTYKLTIGLPGRSNAFAIASKLGISPDIIKNAKHKIDNGTRSFEGLIGKLEKQRLDLEKKREDAEKKLAHAEIMYAEAEKMRKEFNTRIEEENRKAEAKATELLERARASADHVFDSLQEIQRQKDSEDFKQRLEQTREDVRRTLGMVSKEAVVSKRLEAEYLPPRELVPGDDVELSDLGKVGTLVSIDGTQAVVAIGSAKIKTKLKKLRLVEKKKETKASAARTPRKAAEVKTEIDVRGCTCDEAIFMLDKFIDDAVLSSLTTIRVIHGKGTGALRKGLWDYFKHDSRVKEYRMGTFGEGDAGVTVLTLK